MNGDSHCQTLRDLRSFRDIAWEAMAWLHTEMYHDSASYAIFTLFVFSGNAFLWYYWFSYRVVKSRQWHLLMTLYLLLLFSFLSNCLDWWPPPAAYIQSEPIGISCLLSLAIPIAHVYFSPRISLSLILLYDYMFVTDRGTWASTLNKAYRVAICIAYSIIASIYLVITRQVYTGIRVRRGRVYRS